MADLRKLLERENSVFQVVKNYMVAINEEYCDDDLTILRESDEIALIPPIAGG